MDTGDTPGQQTASDGRPTQQQQHRSVLVHRQAIRDLLAPLLSCARVEQLPLMDALGRGLAETIFAPMNLPPFDNSQMDGFAVRSEDLTDTKGELRVGAPVPAGADPAPLETGEAVPIMTGAMMPDWADAVVPIEKAVPNVFPDPKVESLVRLPPVTVGNFVRYAGDDIAMGECALAAGTFLGPRQLGLLAALGISQVQVLQNLTVLLITTGDEVLEPGAERSPGKIFDANNTLLESSLREAGITVIRAGIAKDDQTELFRILVHHLPDVDLIISSGGVSRGAYEVVRQTMSGHDVEFCHVALQPGGPQGIGTFGGVPILAFPGNPVSCLISYEMFLRPVLSEMLGSPKSRVSFRAPLSQSLVSPYGRHQVRRGTLLPDGTVQLEGGEGSHLLRALARSNLLVHIPEEISELAMGDEVEVWAI